MTYGEYCHLNVYNRSELVTDPGIRSDWALALAPTWDNMYKTPGVFRRFYLVRYRRYFPDA